MITARNLKEHYFFSKEDAGNLVQLKPLMEEIKDQVADDFYEFVASFKETSKFMPDEKTIKKHRATFQRWFVNLFGGIYDNNYFMRLHSIGRAHVNIGLDGHYVNAAMNIIRDRVEETVLKENSDKIDHMAFLKSFEKILDMNLDVITSSYREEELKKVFLSYKMDNFLIRFAERFTYGLNLILVISLMAISLMVVGLFIIDLRNIVTVSAEKGILGALGTLLIIWVMIELMENEIRILKGGRFHIQVFLGVVLIAFLREILIASLSHDSLQYQALILSAIIIIGIVYWLVSRAEIHRSPH